MVGQLRDGWVGCKRKARLELEVERHVNDCLVTFFYTFYFFAAGQFFGKLMSPAKPDQNEMGASKNKIGLEMHDG